MTSSIIPLKGGSSNAHQKFKIVLGDFLVGFRLSYVHTSGQWCLDIDVDGATVATGLMLETNCDIIQHHQLNIGKLVFTGQAATLDNLGVDNSLTWVSPDG